MGGGWALGCGQGGGLGGDEVRLLLTLFSPWGALGCRISVEEMRAVPRVLYQGTSVGSLWEGKSVAENAAQREGDLRKQWTESGVETSRATVYRRVQEMGYRCRIPQVKPLLNQKQRQKRLTWATEKQHWTVAQWSKVLFSDESKFCMSFGNQGARVWRKTGEREMPKCLKSSVKYPQSVMVWGAITTWHLLTVPKPLVNGLLTMVLLCSIGLPTLLT
ncbi:hypothetical protein QQF64_010035 [Cirrhinus molitorella]|uniref:Transposase Tc1-like domain-containing protein n=1 Tax=Cirrhinus molitorella TaxID=172907 RepID=A0ABR3M6Z3_9TELE